MSWPLTQLLLSPCGVDLSFTSWTSLFWSFLAKISEHHWYPSFRIWSHKRWCKCPLTHGPPISQGWRSSDSHSNSAIRLQLLMLSGVWFEMGLCRACSQHLASETRKGAAFLPSAKTAVKACKCRSFSRAPCRKQYIPRGQFCFAVVRELYISYICRCAQAVPKGPDATGTVLRVDSAACSHQQSSNHPSPRHPWPLARRTSQTLIALESDAANMDVALQLQLWQVPRWDPFIPMSW